MKTYLLFISLLFICNFSISQNNWWNNDTTKVKESIPQDSLVQKPGKVSVEKDTRIEELIKFKGTTIPPAYGPQIEGYRVQIFFDNNRSAVNKQRAEFIQKHPGIETYIEFKAPNFNLKVGNCRTKLEAEKLKTELLQQFPTAIVISEKIYFPKIKEKANPESPQ